MRDQLWIILCCHCLELRRRSVWCTWLYLSSRVSGRYAKSRKRLQSVLKVKTMIFSGHWPSHINAPPCVLVTGSITAIIVSISEEISQQKCLIFLAKCMAVPMKEMPWHLQWTWWHAESICHILPSQFPNPSVSSLVLAKSGWGQVAKVLDRLCWWRHPST